MQTKCNGYLNGNSLTKKKAPPSFSIVLRSTGGTDHSVSVTIKVTMTLTYPKTVPTIGIIAHENLHPKQVDVLRQVVARMPKSLVGNEMIFEITSALQDQLDEYERMGVEAPSLEEARLNRIKQEDERKRKLQEEQRKKEEEESIEEQKMLERMVQEELRRRNQREEERSGADHVDDLDFENDESGNVVTFDRVIVARKSNGSLVRFKKVKNRIPVVSDFFGDNYIVRPCIPDTADHEEFLLRLSEIDMDEAFWKTAEGRKQLHQFESELESVREFHHQSVVALYDWKLEKKDNGGWKLYLLSQYYPNGTVGDLLDTVDTVNLKVARNWAIQILEALDAIHKAGLLHKHLTVDNTIIFRNKELGDTSVKLGNVTYGLSLIEMNKLHPFKSSVNSIPLPEKWQPPEYTLSGAKPTRKSDIWYFGVLFVKMISGKSTVNEFDNPEDYVSSSGHADALKDFLYMIFKPSPKTRPSAFDLLLSQFLRSDLSTLTPITQPSSNSSTLKSPAPSRSVVRQLSMSSRNRSSFSSGHQMTSFSRYVNDFDEGVVLGRGAYGEVVKARNKVDGRVYAIKKIQSTTDKLGHILQEVWLLSRLYHQYVVRYFTAWIEDDYSLIPGDAVESETEEVSFSLRGRQPNALDLSPDFANHDLSLAASVDLMSHSRSGYPEIQFGDSTDSETSSIDCDSESFVVSRKKSGPRSALFIQMEYCEKHTLADLIKDGLYSHPQEYWRLLRQILEALSHIHSEGVIHRDLKPTNIFIDQQQNIKIGDFGLAKSVAQTGLQVGSVQTDNDDDLTTDVGTTLYVAVEVLQITKSATYNEKIDMYSLGIIFFEMVFPMRTGMERASIIRNLRTSDIRIPSSFSTKKYDSERSIVKSLLNHSPNQRPSARELLTSGLIPLPQKDEIVKEVLQSIVDPNPDSPWLYRVCNALFSRPLSSAQSILYDRSAGNKVRSNLVEAKNNLLKTAVVDHLTELFVKHGAVENNDRSDLFPRAVNYDSNTVVELMDPTGNIVQLPYDLTLPYARKLAENIPDFQKSYKFGKVYRADQRNKGVHPIVCSEVDFDIVTADSADIAYHEAEVLQVLDEAVRLFPCFKQSSVCLYLNHSDILDSILDYCGFTAPQRGLALRLLGQIGQSPAHSDVKNELLSKFSLSATALNDLEMFGFRDDLEKTEQRILKLTEGSELPKKFKDAMVHMKMVVSLMTRLGVTRKIYIAPLSNYNDNFYKGSIMFQAVIEEKQQKNILAAGGRYDSLIAKYRQLALDARVTVGAVGFNFALDKVIDMMISYRDSQLRKLTKHSRATVPDDSLQPWLKSRCDVLISSFSTSNIKGLCLDILRDLWAHGIRADLVREVHSSEMLVSMARQDGINWLVVVKQLNSYTQSNFKPLRVKNLNHRSDIDLGFDELIPHLLVELDKSTTGRAATHAARTGPGQIVSEIDMDSTIKSPQLVGLGGGDSSTGSMAISNKINVIAEAGKLKGGKKNRWQLEENCKAGVNNFLALVGNAPIYSLDVWDDTLNAIVTASPNQIDEWKRKVVGTAPNQKAYLMNVQTVLAKEMARQTKYVILYSSKMESVVLYQLN